MFSVLCIFCCKKVTCQCVRWQNWKSSALFLSLSECSHPGHGFSVIQAFQHCLMLLAHSPFLLYLIKAKLSILWRGKTDVLSPLCHGTSPDTNKFLGPMWIQDSSYSTPKFLLSPGGKPKLYERVTVWQATAVSQRQLRDSLKFNNNYLNRIQKRLPWT